MRYSPALLAQMTIWKQAINELPMRKRLAVAARVILGRV